ncbi:MAG: peptidase M61, partial [Gammaproteobacteria bacterium]
MAKPDPAGQEFAIPAWIPGSYLIRDLARQVVVIGAEAEGREIDLSKTDNSTWQADPCESPLTLTAQIYAYDLSVRGAHVDTTHAFFDGACVFPVVVGQEDQTCQLDILPPQKSVGNDWRVATSMQPLSAKRYEFGTYVAANYAELIDHPVEMGDI